MAKKAAQAITSGPGTRAAAPDVQTALHELVERAKQHKQSGEGQARAGRVHERSCATVCRCVVRLERSLTLEQRAALFEEAVRRRLLSKGSRGDEVTKLARLACGAGESKSVVARIAAVARHLAEPGRDLDAVLPETARFWAVYEELRPTFVARRGKATKPPLSIQLEDGFVERIRAGAAGMLRVAWDPTAGRPVATEIVVGDLAGPADGQHGGAESGDAGRDVAANKLQGGVAADVEDDGRQLQGLERADQEEQVGPEAEPVERLPPLATADGAPRVSSGDAKDRALEAADGAIEIPVGSPSDRAAGAGEPDPPPLVIAFAAHVAKDDPTGFGRLKMHGRFERIPVEGRRRAVWTGRPFDGLDALISVHGGRHVGP